MAMIFKKVLGVMAVWATAVSLVACGGGNSTAADTTAPTVKSFSVKDGSAIARSTDGSFAVSGNLGSTQAYTITFAEKLDATNYSVKMLDSGNAQVALPTGMMATLSANDASNQSYTLTITTDERFVFDAGQPSKAVKLQISVSDAAMNTAKVDVTEMVLLVAPTVPSNIPTSFNATGSIGSIDLSNYMQRGWVIQVVSVSDPGAVNGVGSPTVTVNGGMVTITAPLFYGGPYDIQIALRFENAAGRSSDFVITAKGLQF